MSKTNVHKDSGDSIGSGHCGLMLDQRLRTPLNENLGNVSLKRWLPGKTYKAKDGWLNLNLTV